MIIRANVIQISSLRSYLLKLKKLNYTIVYPRKKEVCPLVSSNINYDEKNTSRISLILFVKIRISIGDNLFSERKKKKKKKTGKNYEGLVNSSTNDEDSSLCKRSGVEVKVKTLSRLIRRSLSHTEFHARDGILSRSKERRSVSREVWFIDWHRTDQYRTVCICIFNEAGSSCRWRVTTNASIANATRYGVSCQSTTRRLSKRSMSKM